MELFKALVLCTLFSAVMDFFTLTTNLPLGRWDEVFTSQLAASAILDRLVHHAHIISITGDSYRVKGKHKEGVS